MSAVPSNQTHVSREELLRKSRFALDRLGSRPFFRLYFALPARSSVLLSCIRCREYCDSPQPRVNTFLSVWQSNTKKRERGGIPHRRSQRSSYLTRRCHLLGQGVRSRLAIRLSDATDLVPRRACFHSPSWAGPCIHVRTRQIDIFLQRPPGGVFALIFRCCSQYSVNNRRHAPTMLQTHD